MIEDTTFLKKLKAGDKVIYCTWGNFRRYEEYVATVEKITPSGFIKVHGILFNTNGEPRGDWRCRLKQATPEKIKEIQETKYILETLNIMHSCEALTYEQAKAIRAALDMGTKTDINP